MTDFFETPMTPELLCSDIGQSLEFYVDTLGFTVQYARDEDGFAMLAYQGSRLMLDEIVPGSARSWIAADLEKPFGRGINLQIRTNDVNGVYARVQAASAQVFLPMEEKWYRRDDVLLGNRQFIVLDPDGYMLRFFEDIGTKSAV